jgi:hypothetical protein
MDGVIKVLEVEEERGNATGSKLAGILAREAARPR